MRIHRHVRKIGFPLFIVLGALRANGQANLPIYTDRLVNGFQDWSWAARNMAGTTPTHAGANSIQVNANAWEAISLHQNDFNSSVYANFTFWAHGGPTGGQLLQVSAELGGAGQPAFALSPAVTANTWQQYTVPLNSLGAANKTNLSRLTIQLRAGGSTSTFYLDDIQLTANAGAGLAVVAMVFVTCGLAGRTR